MHDCVSEVTVISTSAGANVIKQKRGRKGQHGNDLEIMKGKPDKGQKCVPLAELSR